MIAGLILAGGEARRLGGIDKPLLPLGDTSMAARIAAMLAPQVCRLALSANGDPVRYAALGLPVLADERPGLGPLGGILRGLDWAATLGATDLLTVPGDTPFIPADLAARLSPGPSVAVSAGRTHHAVALWPVAAAARLRGMLAAPGSRAVAAFAAALSTRPVVFAAASDRDDPFFNVNTPDELALARERL